jgi:hypothetical protein
MLFPRVISIDLGSANHPRPYSVPRRTEVASLPGFDVLADLLVGHPDVGLLVHSSSRVTYGEDELRDMLHPLASRFAGVAPTGYRPHAVEQWLMAHPGVQLLALHEEPNRFAGIDGYWVVACDVQHGLSDPHVQSSIKGWLGRTAPLPPPRHCRADLDVLYLDFDGVLSPSDVWRSISRGAYLHERLVAQGHRLFEHVGLLEKQLLPYPNLSIVLSTTWVHTYSFSGAARRLPKSLRDRCIGATYHSQMHKDSFARMPRGLQVLNDVRRRKPRRWLALDDVDDGWGIERDHLVLTHCVEGIAHPPVLEELRMKLLGFRQP